MRFVETKLHRPAPIVQRNKPAPALHSPHGMPGIQKTHGDKSMPYSTIFSSISVELRKIMRRNTRVATEKFPQMQKSCQPPATAGSGGQASH